MSLYMQKALALWEPDYEELKEKHEKIFDRADSVRKEETPDETYIVAYWDFIAGDDSDMEALMRDVECIRHAAVSIREDGDVFKDIECKDCRGTDEEFYEILGWKAEICVWNDPSDVLTEYPYRDWAYIVTDGSGTIRSAERGYETQEDAIADKEKAIRNLKKQGVRLFSSLTYQPDML